jgi:magnesium-transporting ATPase (P-type)
MPRAGKTLWPSLSERKMMSVVTRNRESGVTQVFAKGAPDFLSTQLTKEGDEMILNRDL